MTRGFEDLPDERREAPGRGRPGPRPSQVLLEDDRIDGELLDRLTRARDPVAMLTYVPGERRSEAHARDGMLPWAAPPLVTWAVGDRAGPLSPLSFVALWNAKVDVVDGFKLGAEVKPGDGIALPWVWWHPSGCHQAIRYDIASDTFRRRLLYPADR